MASRIPISSIYTGQLLWAFFPPNPYWPSIVCDSETGNTKILRKPYVHVRFCASGKVHWVQLHNVFEFNGYDDYLSKKRHMKIVMSDDDFNKQFDATNNEIWRKAIIEATFVMEKDVDSRLFVVNILDEINFELSNIASKIHFEDATVPALDNNKLSKRQSSSEPQHVIEHSTTIQSIPSDETASKERNCQFEESEKAISEQPLDVNKSAKRQSLPTTKRSYNLRRRSLPPPQVIVQIDNSTTEQSIPSTQTSSIKLVTKFEEFEKAISEYAISSYPENILFDGIVVRNVCKICYSADDGNDGKLVKCSACDGHVHIGCLNKNSEESFVRLPETPDAKQKSRRSSIRIRLEPKVLCNDCQLPSICFACKEVLDDDVRLKKCDVESCSRCYHIQCLDKWKQIEFFDSKLKCPLHFCHTCSSTKTDQKTPNKFTFCIKCPTVYHIHSCCIPAGTIILTQKHHICIRHRCNSRRDLTTLDWCVRCGKEGDTLICCGSCPKTYHISCLDSSEVPDPFLCDTCDSGRSPLYGDMVIAKYWSHPWWPAIIVPPFQIPAHMFTEPPDAHEFCIRFFGDYSFGWIGRSSVYFYSKSEAARFSGDNPAQELAFTEASNWFDKADNNNNLKGSQTQPIRQPPQYVKIKNIITVPPAKLTKSLDEPESCSCTRDDPCGPTSNCANRQMSVECDPKHCPNGTNCKNQYFERKADAAVKVVFINEQKGFGVIADEFINAGSFVMEYVGELITERELNRRKRHKEKTAGTQHVYFMTYSKGLYIDADRKGCESRFVNHSCDPNCQTQKWTVNNVDRIGYFALKDIEKGTEITIDYDFNRGEVHQCFCGERNCEGVIGRQKAKN